jgi:hypothetical protein
MKEGLSEVHDGRYGGREREAVCEHYTKPQGLTLTKNHVLLNWALGPLKHALNIG